MESKFISEYVWNINFLFLDIIQKFKLRHAFGSVQFIGIDMFYL